MRSNLLDGETIGVCLLGSGSAQFTRSTAVCAHALSETECMNLFGNGLGEVTQPATSQMSS